MFRFGQRALVILCLAGISGLAIEGASAAQTFRGSILGTVLDSNGAAVPDAGITVKNFATGLTRKTVTDAAGNFNVPELAIGTYELTVEKANFAPATVKDLKVDVGGERRVDVTLVAGGVEQAVEVRATVPLVETTQNVLGGIIESKQAEVLPINGRDFTKLLVLVAGASGSPDGATDSPGSFGLFSANGNRGRSNNYLLDGTDMNDGYRNLPAINEAGVFGTPATILPVEAISQVGVLSHFEAEYGRNAGSVVNIVTKSGTNEIHGTAYEFFRNNNLNARNFFNPVPDPETQFRNNQFGFSLGGPIIKDRTFWFINYEGQREGVGLNSVARVPSPAEIAALGGPTNPVIARLLARNPWPAPSRAVPLFANEPNLFTTTRAKNDVSSVIAKIDHSFNERNTITGRYYFGDSDQSFPLALLAGNILPGFNTNTPTRVQLVSLSYIHVFSPRLVGEARFGYNRFGESFLPEDRSLNPNSIGLNTVSDPQDFGLPFIRIRNDPKLGSSIASIGSTLADPRGRADTNWQAINNYSWKLTRHDVKFGFEYRRTAVNQFFDAGFRGRLDFDSLQDFLAGRLSGGRSARGDSRRGTAQDNFGYYIQDSFQWRRNVTLNYGLRWDYFGILHEERNRLSNFDPRIGLVQVGKGIGRLYGRDLDNYAPRVSVAWDIQGKGKTVLRAGWGIFYDSFSQDFFVGQLPFNTFNPGPAFNPIGPSPILFSFSTVPVIQDGQPVFTDFLDTDVFAVQRNLRTPYVQNFSLNLQQEVSKNLVFEVGYVGGQGRKLFRYRDINQPVNPARSTRRPFDRGPFAPSGRAFGFVNFFESSAVSNYNALQTSVRIRDWHGLNSTLNWTYSHSIDNASDGQDFVANATQPDNSFRADLERANSNFDIRHRVSWTFSYDIPQFAKNWKRLTGGWQISGLVSIQSGAPFHVNLFNDFNGTGEFFPRPDLVGNPYAGTRGADRFLNLAAFRVPCTLDANGACIPGSFHFGSLGRNSLRGPDFRNFDFSILKNTNITERVKIQFRAEFFNIFNHPNLSSPLLPGFAADASFNGLTPSGRGIGFLPITVTPDVGIGNPFLGGGGPRNVQLALKLLF